MHDVKITEAATQLGISTRAIRFYEEKGLLTPAKEKHNGYRLFSDQDLVRLQTIISLREAGLSLSDLRNVLETYGMEEPEELMYLLELQRSLLYARRLDLEGQIRMNEELIERISHNSSLPSSALLFGQAEITRRARELREGWVDHYRFDTQAEQFDLMVGSGHADYPGYEAALALLVAQIRPQPGEIGLDLGTGTGNLAGALLASGASMKAMDQSRRMLQICRHKHPMMETRLGNMLAVPFSNGGFDFAVSSYAFHLLTREERLLALREIIRILKPEGRLGIGCPLSEPEWPALQEELRILKYRTVLLSVPCEGKACVLIATPNAE